MRALVALVLLASCGSPPRAVWGYPVDGPCVLSVCLPGAGGPEAGDNPLFAEWCGLLPGSLLACDDETGCTALAPDAEWARRGFEHVIQILDDATARSCEVRLAGYSWGGVDALSWAGDILRRASPPNRVSAVVLVDPYAPFAGEVLDVPEGIGGVVSFRHSVAVPDGCSSADPLGPYRGLPIRCGPRSACREFDLSADGTPHDHCWMVEDTLDGWFPVMAGGHASALRFPGEVPVARRE